MRFYAVLCVWCFVVGEGDSAARTFIEGGQSFLRWIEAEFGMAEVTAHRFMKAAERFGDKFFTVKNLRKLPEVADKARCILVAAEARVGEELASEPKAKGTQGQLVGPGPGRGKTGGTKVEPPVSDAPFSQVRVEEKKNLAEPCWYRQVLTSLP